MCNLLWSDGEGGARTLLVSGRLLRLCWRTCQSRGGGAVDAQSPLSLVKQ